MKRRLNTPIGIILLLFLSLALAACVRPVPGSETQTAGSTPDVIVPLPSLTPELVLPDLSPSPTPQSVVPPVGEVTPETQPVPEPTAVPETSTGLPTTHTVQPGESLFSISQIYGVSINEIMVANGITDPNALTVGQVLTIPAPGTAPQPPTGGGQQSYVVQPGNNLFRIGLQFGCTAAQLAQYNGIPNMTLIYPGQVIQIPPSC